MAEAIFGLIGVVIGSVFGLIGTYLQQRSLHKQWKIERQATCLQNERERCTKVFDAAMSHVLPLIPGADDQFVDLYKLLSLQVPPEVMKEIAKLSGTGEIRTPEQAFAWMLGISNQMGEHLARLDKRITELLS